MKQTKKLNNLEGSCLLQKKANGLEIYENPSAILRWMDFCGCFTEGGTATEVISLLHRGK